MPNYPSSATGGTYFTNPRVVSNLTSYQELKDHTIGAGSGANDVTSPTYVSQAKYPTDTNIGGPWRASSGTGAALGSSSVRDLELALVNLAAAGMAVTAETTSMTANELLVSPNFSTLTFNNVQSKLEKVTYELQRLAEDLAKINANTAGGAVTTPPGRYPSSWNRYTNSAGGI